jgi:hypothetical protein
MMLNVPSVVYHPFGMGSLGDDCGTDDNGNPIPCDDSGGGVFAGSTGNSGAASSSSDICPTTDASGNCLSCASGYVLSGGVCTPSSPSVTASLSNSNPDSNGFTQQGCANAGRTWSGGVCLLNSPTGPVMPAGAQPYGSYSGLTSFLNTLVNDTPKIISSITGNPLPGAVNYTPWLIGAAVLFGAVLLMGSGGKR